MLTRSFAPSKNVVDGVVHCGDQSDRQQVHYNKISNLAKKGRNQRTSFQMSSYHNVVQGVNRMTSQPGCIDDELKYHPV